MEKSGIILEKREHFKLSISLMISYCITETECDNHCRQLFE